MKTNYRLTLTLMAAAVIGIAGDKLIYGQQAKAPPGYVIAEVQVTDPTAMRKYGEKMPETLAPFNHIIWFGAESPRVSRARRLTVL